MHRHPSVWVSPRQTQLLLWGRRLRQNCAAISICRSERILFLLVQPACSKLKLQDIIYNPGHSVPAWSRHHCYNSKAVSVTLFINTHNNLLGFSANMGVTKLWDILLTIAVQKRIEDLSGLTLAIDSSIWIVKINSIYETIDEGLKCIFNKLVWLRKNNINPIFVFDGQTPLLKRKTLEQRRSRRKELNTLDIIKKVEIEVVKTVTGSQSTQKSDQTAAYQEKSKQIELMLANLFKYGNATNTIELSEKMALQAEVLNKKYELYLEMYPALSAQFGTLQYFSSLDIQSKQEMLEAVKETGLPSAKDLRNFKGRMTEEEKIMYEMEVIKRKSQIRELQDNLYRKVMTKKIENGYQIIEGVYNGTKVIQKRKVKPKGDGWSFSGANNRTCNDFKSIFLKNRDNCMSEKEEEEQDRQEDFFAKIFRKDYNVQKKNVASSSFSQLSSRLSGSSCSRNSQKGQTIETDKGNRSNQQQFTYDDIFDVEQGEKSSTENRGGQDPDHFPDFIMIQGLDELNTSDSNIHLQNMLDILGITYIVAPFEAEAQCAALQQMELVDGVVTQDSDVFLFGARKVYRGVFQDNIKLYSMRRIEQSLLLTREKLILFGLMLGSDYTDGVKGIGIVNAMQILKVHHDIESLRKFTSWARSADILQENDENKTDHMLREAISEDQVEFYKLHRKFKNYWHIHPSFPQQNIYDAYLEPAVQQGGQLQTRIKGARKVDIQALRKLMEDKFKMVPVQLELNTKILTRPFVKKTQAQITDYSEGGFARIASKRLQKAINLTGIGH